MRVIFASSRVGTNAELQAKLAHTLRTTYHQLVLYCIHESVHKLLCEQCPLVFFGAASTHECVHAMYAHRSQFVAGTVVTQ
jgi:hypothetical protein